MFSIEEHIIRATSCGVVVTDPALPDNPVIYVNDAFTEITGYSPEEILGRNCRFLQGPETDRANIEYLKGCIAARTHCQIVLRNYRKDGTLFWNELRVSPIFDESGELRNFIGIQNDVSERENMKLQRDDFVATLIHDLKSPLFASQKILEALCSEFASDDGKTQLIRTLIHSNEHMRKMVNSVLDAYKAEAGAIVAAPEVIELKSFLHGCLEGLEPIASDKSIELVLEGNVCKVNADRALMQRVLTNLVENAVKFSPPQEQVLVRIQNGSEQVCIDVVNKGSTISDVDIPNLFKRFRQNVEGNRYAGGHGLGLFFCQAVARAHGGHVRYIPLPEGGSIFKLSLPGIH